MIDAKQAVVLAKQSALEMLAQSNSNLEEIEKESYQGREAWSITLSLPRNLEQLPAFARIAADPLTYKRFLIDMETGELLAMRLREPASR